MENYQAASIGDSDPSLDFYMILASFASIAARCQAQIPLTLSDF
jgi:hypothetical protein